MTLNTRPYLIRNYKAQGPGWTLDTAGVVVLNDTTGYVELTITANIQPYTARVRDPEGAGFITLRGIKLFIEPSASGVWPEVIAGDNTDRKLPTLVKYEGRWHEVRKAKGWTRGLMPHMYAEAMLLDAVLPAGPASDEVKIPSEDGTETVKLRW